MRNAAFCITGLALQGLSMSLMAQTDKPNIVIIMTISSVLTYVAEKVFLWQLLLM